MNMTMAEWTNHIGRMQARVAAEWPEIKTEIAVNGRALYLVCPDGICRAQLSLMINEDDKSFNTLLPRADFGSGSALIGSTNEVAHGARRYMRMAEALQTIEQISTHLVIESSSRP